MPDLLFEIGTEEVPAGYLEPALRQLADGLRRLLKEHRLEASCLRTAGTPRRMAVFAEGLPAEQPPLRSRSMGPPASVAFDDEGQPTPAATGFARSKDVELESLQIEQTEKGPYVVAVVEQPGRSAAEVLPRLLRQATAEVVFPKSMRWEESGFQFARPIRGLVALLDDEVLKLEIAGVPAGRTTAGHPFLAPEGLELASADWQHYVDGLREAFVVVQVEERRGMVRRQMEELLAPHAPEMVDETLLAEVTNLVEWPHAVEGTFDEQFLDVPAAVLVAAMKEHQRYFPVWSAQGELLARFITVFNRTAKQDDLVRQGNERVLTARLQDARFFWEEDREAGLQSFVPRLSEVTFLAGLGNNLQRSDRLAELGGRIAAMLGCDGAAVRRAGHLCKADLLSGLVGEFPSLQGIVGRELALQGGEPQVVADAIAEHYLPAGTNGALPQTIEACCLALADKLDVILGCFSLGLEPTGSQDPYALRRNALGVLLIVEQRDLPLRLEDLVEAASDVAQLHGIELCAEGADGVLAFFRDRLYHAALDRSYAHDFVRAVIATDYGDVGGFWRRLEALDACSRRSWWPELVELVDRTYRIQRDLEQLAGVRADLLAEPLERQLTETLSECQAEIQDLFETGDYVAAANRYCHAFARLVHDFFEEVFVNVEDEAVRVNRKSLCGHVYRLFADHFADLYLIETA